MKRISVALSLGLCLAWPGLRLSAQEPSKSFTPEFTGRTGDKSEGFCSLRLVIGGETEVVLQGNKVTLRAIRGRLGYSVHSVCSEPFPGRVPDWFIFTKQSGRGQAVLREAPLGDLSRVVVRVFDQAQDNDEYVLMYRWRP